MAENICRTASPTFDAPCILVNSLKMRFEYLLLSAHTPLRAHAHAHRTEISNTVVDRRKKAKPDLSIAADISDPWAIASIHGP